MSLITTFAKGDMNLALFSLYGLSPISSGDSYMVFFIKFKNLEFLLVSFRYVPEFSTLIRLKIVVLVMTTLTLETEDLIYISVNSFNPNYFLDFLAFLGSLAISLSSSSFVASLPYTSALTQKCLIISE